MKTRMTPQAKIEVQEIAYHRNGISGAPFHAVRFVGKTDGPNNTPANFLATVFEEPGYVAVICLDLLPEHGVAFTKNSWRGDSFEAELRAALAKQNLEKYGTTE